MTSKIYEIADQQSKLINELLEMLKVANERLDALTKMRDDMIHTFSLNESDVCDLALGSPDYITAFS
jgi:ABC-type phosphate transport system auxiliary subunit